MRRRLVRPRPWEGLVFWDLIQPAFMFMVGVAMPFALAARTARGASERDNFRHVLARSLRLTLLSQILISVGSGRIKLQMIIVLSQIAFTYFLSYLDRPVEVAVAGRDRGRPARVLDGAAVRISGP